MTLNPLHRIECDRQYRSKCLSIAVEPYCKRVRIYSWQDLMSIGKVKFTTGDRSKIQSAGDTLDNSAYRSVTLLS